METVTVGFRSLLRQELVQRCKRNPAYSARAMARDLRVSPAFLSQLLSGKRKLSEPKSHEIAQKMGWEHDQRRIFTTLVRYENTQSMAAREGILQELRTMPQATELAFTDLSVEFFRVVADWHHTAIAELTLVEGFKSDPKWIAQRLGIRSSEAEEALDRLKRVGLLVEQDGKLKKAESRTRITDIPSEAIREFHKQMIDRAKDALDHQTHVERDVTGTTMAIDPALLPQARELIRNFRWQLMQLLEGGKRKSVYQLSVQLFRLEAKGSK